MSRVSPRCRSSLAASWLSPTRLTAGFTVWTSTQVPFAVRAAIAAALSLAEEQVRVIAPDVGGGFGAKGHVYPEDVLIPAGRARGSADR